MATELELHWQVSVTVPPTFEQALAHSPCLTNQLSQMKDADKEHDKNNLNLLFLTILSGVRQTNPKNVFFFFFCFFSWLCLLTRLQKPTTLELAAFVFGQEATGLEPSSPVLGSGVNHYPSRFIFRTSLKGPLTQ